uniref:Uncharacterized protein n=1 Tax=Arundo donax TaxID=35708 RepID=A0A0A9MSF6_ARUDO
MVISRAACKVGWSKACGGLVQRTIFSATMLPLGISFVLPLCHCNWDWHARRSSVSLLD